MCHIILFLESGTVWLIGKSLNSVAHVISCGPEIPAFRLPRDSQAGPPDESLPKNERRWPCDRLFAIDHSSRLQRRIQQDSQGSCLVTHHYTTPEFPVCFQLRFYSRWNWPFSIIVAPSTIIVGLLMTPSRCDMQSQSAPVWLGPGLPNAMWTPGNFSSWRIS